MASGEGGGSKVRRRRTKSRGVSAVQDRPRARRKRPSSVEDLYGGGESGSLLHGDFLTDKQLYAWFQKRHKRGLALIDEEGYYRKGRHVWKVPYGVRMAMKEPLTATQVANKYPFYVTWVSPKTGKRLKKYVSCMAAGIILIGTKIQYVDEDASIVARNGFYIPPKLRGKFPRRMGPQKRMHYWCPRCMQPRRFRRTGDDFLAMKKFWNETKGRYEWKNVTLALLECECCKITNRDAKFRSSNQPWEKRKIKQGVRRIKKRRRK